MHFQEVVRGKFVGGGSVTALEPLNVSLPGSYIHAKGIPPHFMLLDLLLIPLVCVISACHTAIF